MANDEKQTVWAATYDLLNRARINDDLRKPGFNGTTVSKEFPV